MEKNILYYGKNEVLTKKTKLHAGELDLVYENGFLRYIQLGEYEALRMINHAVRDHNWNTIPFIIAEEKIDISARSFSIYYTARAIQGAVDFMWQCQITGSEDSTVNFMIEGEALSNFKRNRIGFTVLHPIQECIGKSIRILHPDGKSDINKFPILISPNQPFVDISGMEWSLGKIKALLEFKGDIFETEDQRNWIDESYKTYCTPLSKPFPIDIKKGDSVRQEISLKVEGMGGKIPDIDQKLSFSINSTPYYMPKIGIGQSTEVKALSEDQIIKLKKVSFDHFQADLKLYDENWAEQWNRINNESDLLELPVELSLFFNDLDKELVLLKGIAGKRVISVSLVNVFNKKADATQKETIVRVFPELRKIFTNAEIGAGTNAFFTELNRDRAPTDALDFLVYSINPQVHSFDNNTLVENVFTVPYTIKTAKEFSNDMSVNISPITFKMRWNPAATEEEIIQPDQLPDEVDQRQMSLFGACWVVGLLNNCLSERPKVLSFFETVGLKGIMQSESPLHSDQFQAPRRMFYPIYYIFRIILENKSGNFYQIEASHPKDFSGLAWGKDKPDTILLVNFTINPLEIHLPDQFHPGSLLTVDENNFETIMYNPDKINSLEINCSDQFLDLQPFGIAIVKIATKKMDMDQIEKAINEITC